MNPLESLSAEERNAQETLRVLSHPQASTAFRARLKQEFVSGTIGPGMLADRSRSPGADRSTRPEAWILRGPWPLPLRTGAIAAVAAAVVAVTVLALNRPGDWIVSQTTGVGIAVVDGRPIPLDHESELAAAIKPGSRVRVPIGAELEVSSLGNLVVQITAGTDVTLPSPPARWFGRTIRAQVQTGELRIATGLRFRGARLAIGTPEADVEVTGTTLAVICEPHGTCVCVLEGGVRVGAKGGEMIEVQAGRRRFVFKDAHEAETDDMRPMERQKLGMMRESKAAILEGRRPN